MAPKGPTLGQQVTELTAVVAGLKTMILQAREHTASVVAYGLQGVAMKQDVNNTVEAAVQQQLTQSEHLQGLVSQDEMISVIRQELNKTMTDPDVIQSLRSSFDSSQDGTTPADRTSEPTIAALKEELLQAIVQQVRIQLTRDSFVDQLRTQLGSPSTSPSSSSDGDSGTPSRARPRKLPTKNRNVKLQQLVHHWFHVLLRKPYRKSSHWPELTAVPDESDATHHWPRPAPDIFDQPVSIPVSDILKENRLVKSAIKRAVDVNWSDEANANIESAISSPTSTTTQDSSPGSQFGLRIMPPASADGSGSDDRRAVVWRPDFRRFPAKSSTAFRAEVLKRCIETLQSTQSAGNQPTSREIDDEIATYWENIRKEFSVQMHAFKRNAKVVQQRRDRRRLRAERVLKDRFERFVYSPVVGTTNFKRIRKAIAGPHSWTPDYLSDDEEDRFVAREELDERELYFMESTRRPSRYDKSAVWESREAFWMTYECRMASIVLDEYIRKQKVGVTPVFRAPYDISQRNLRARNPVWPRIRKQDSNGEPDEQGDGYVIYRFMVNHEKVSHLEGYSEWADQLWEDPPIEAAPPTQSGFIPVTERTLQASCELATFAPMALWNEARNQNEQWRLKRVADETLLVERYRQLKARGNLPIGGDDDEEMDM